MGRVGLVARIEDDLEREISLGLLPRDRGLPSEQVLARSYGVSRATAREALLRLAARGLVEQHPGRTSRAVDVEETVTLENLSVALHGADGTHPERLRLLEGYLALKREAAVELLAACCERASDTDLNRLADACFMLWGTGPWEQHRRWVEQEFDLLRLAALVADRPGHFLLIQSLERSFWGMAGRLMPHLDSEAIRQWSLCAYNVLLDRDVQALRRELPALLQAGDEHLLGSMVPSREADGTVAQASHAKAEPPPGVPSEAEPEKEALPGAVSSDWSGCPTGSCQAPPAGGLPPELASTGFNHLLGHLEPEPDATPGREKAGRSTWSPVLWARASSPAGTAATLPGSALRQQEG
jgi:DNA-binding FadR family transcriptional regulator